MCARELLLWLVVVVMVVRMRIVRGGRRELVLRLGGQRSYVTTIVE
jgi:hypothetical protein